MKTKDFWDKQHHAYAKTTWVDHPSLFAEWAINYFPPKGTLLELGAGNGFDSRFFASKGYHVTSTDFSTSALDYNNKKAPDTLKKQMQIQEVDISKPLPYADNAFDIVYSHLAIHYFTTATTKRLFDEMYRVLKPEGAIALLTNSTTDPEYNSGKKIEEDYFQIRDIPKRFFNTDSMRRFGGKFEVLACDSDGTTYKDQAKGVNNLIRFVGEKLE